MAMGVDRWKTVECGVCRGRSERICQDWLNYAMEAWKAVWLDSASVGPQGTHHSICKITAKGDYSIVAAKAEVWA